METGAYKYQNADRLIYFRGYVQKYQQNKLLIKTCSLVRNTKALALKDAKALKKQITCK